MSMLWFRFVAYIGKSSCNFDQKLSYVECNENAEKQWQPAAKKISRTLLDNSNSWSGEVEAAGRGHAAGSGALQGQLAAVEWL